MTRRRIEFDDDAKAEMRRARQWYVDNKPSRVDELEEDFTQAIDRIAEEGETLPIYDGDARRILLANFPYGIVFEVIGDTVFVTVVTHLKRAPGYWKK